MSSVRLFFVGGLLSFRALFGWLSPWILIPTYVIAPIFQILLFVYIGRAAKTQSDEFYVIGNALQYAAIPCVFAMTQTIAGERYQHTLGFILVSPARRLPLFLGRAVPVIVNGFAVSVFALFVGGALLDVHIAPGAWPSIAFVTKVVRDARSRDEPLDHRRRARPRALSMRAGSENDDPRTSRHGSQLGPEGEARPR